MGAVTMPSSYTPLVVEPHYFLDDPGWSWAVRVGKNRILDGAVTKADAVSKAESLLEASNTIRPGVVVLNSDGTFHRFISNDRYWDEWAEIS